MNFDLCGVAKLSSSSKKTLRKENYCCFFLNFARVNDGKYIPSDKKKRTLEQLFSPFVSPRLASD